MKKHCLEIIMKKPKKIPFGIILVFVFTSCSIKAKQIWPFNFFEWPNSLSFYCTYFLHWVTLLYMKGKKFMTKWISRGFFQSFPLFIFFVFMRARRVMAPFRGKVLLSEGNFYPIEKTSSVCSEIFNVLPLWRTTVKNWPPSRGFLLSLSPCKPRNSTVGCG